MPTDEDVQQSPPKQAMEVTEAIQRALTFIQTVIKDNRVGSMLLEEVELSEDSRYWLITISLPSPVASGALFVGNAGRQERDYKVVRIDAQTGKVESIKMRKV